MAIRDDVGHYVALQTLDHPYLATSFVLCLWGGALVWLRRWRVATSVLGAVLLTAGVLGLLAGALRYSLVSSDDDRPGATVSHPASDLVTVAEVRTGLGPSKFGVAVSVTKDRGLVARQHELMGVSILHEPVVVRMVAPDTIEVVQCRLTTTIVIDPDTLDPRSTRTTPRATTDALPTDGALLPLDDPLDHHCPASETVRCG